MARTFRRARQMHPIADLNVTNLVDLGFTLLIIFMIATPLITQNEQTTRVNLPVVDAVPQPKADPDQRFESITVRADGTLDFLGRSMTQTQLSAELVRLAAQPKPPTIRIRGDANVPWQKVASVINAVEKNQLSKISFDTQTAR